MPWTTVASPAPRTIARIGFTCMAINAHCNTGTQRNPKTPGGWFTSNCLVKNPMNVAHLRSELNLRVRVSLRSDIGFNIFRSTGYSGKRSCQCSNSNAKYNVVHLASSCVL